MRCRVRRAGIAVAVMMERHFHGAEVIEDFLQLSKFTVRILPLPQVLRFPKEELHDCRILVIPSGGGWHGGSGTASAKVKSVGVELKG